VKTSTVTSVVKRLGLNLSAVADSKWIQLVHEIVFNTLCLHMGTPVYMYVVSNPCYFTYSIRPM